MISRKSFIGLLSLVFLAMLTSAAPAYVVMPAAAPPVDEDLFEPAVAKPDKPSKTTQNYRYIVKCRPVLRAESGRQSAWGPHGRACLLPRPKTRGWEMMAQAFFARTRGKSVYLRGNQQWIGNNRREVDYNTDLALPDHTVLADFSITYRFRPRWSATYALMPMDISGSGDPGRGFQFGNNSYSTGQGVRVKWERLYHRAGLAYEPLRSHRSRVSLFANYVRLEEKLSVSQTNMNGDVMHNDLNMAMAGMEFEKCLKNRRFGGTLSLECKAGVAFLDQAVGSDLSTGIKYSISMGNGRRGYVSGGYRFLTYKKSYSDVFDVDTAMDGGYLQMGFVF